MSAQRRIQVSVLFATIILVCPGIRAAESELTRYDIAKIKTVCRSLLGVEDWRLKEIFNHSLLSYVRSNKAIAESTQIECSFHCGGTLLLRGDADIWYGFQNQPIGVTHRIDSVAFHVQGKRIFAVGPGLAYYPYPYYEAEVRKRAASKQRFLIECFVFCTALDTSAATMWRVRRLHARSPRIG